MVPKKKTSSKDKNKFASASFVPQLTLIKKVPSANRENFSGPKNWIYGVH